VDWIDACRERRLSALIDLYDDAAIVDCCEGGRFRGRSEVEGHWRPKLLGQMTGAFEIDVLMSEADGVSLDYRGYDGKPVRTHFRFTAAGKILHTACGPVQSDHPGSMGKPRAACSVSK
jgi:hypothetical protein